MKIILPLALVVLLASANSTPAKPPPKPSAEPTQQQAARPSLPEMPAGADCARSGALPDSWSGVAYAVDGDTLGGVGLKAPIRLWGIQAPELRDANTRQETVAGMRARATLEDILAKSDHKLRCRAARFDASCRLVAHCTLDAGADSIDVGGAMIASGMAYGFELGEALTFEPKAAQRYADAEGEARKQRRGLWPAWLGEK